MSGRSYKHEATEGKPHQNQETTWPKVQVANLSRLQRLLTKRIKRRNSCQKCDKCCEQFTWTDGLKRSQYIYIQYKYVLCEYHVIYIDIESKHIAVKIPPNLLKVNASRAIRIALLISIETSDPFASFQMHLRVIWHSSSIVAPSAHKTNPLSVLNDTEKAIAGQNKLAPFDQQSNALKYPHFHLNFSARPPPSLIISAICSRPACRRKTIHSQQFDAIPKTCEKTHTP